MSNTEQKYRHFEKVNLIIEEHQRKQSALISILQEIQEEYRYLPEEILTYVATAMDVSPSKVFGVATFYENFSLEPKGKYVIKVCDGTACHVKKSQDIINTISKHLELPKGEHTTKDMLFTLETVSCLGACGLAPVMLINEKVYGKVSTDEIKKILSQIKEEEEGQ